MCSSERNQTNPKDTPDRQDRRDQADHPDGQEPEIFRMLFGEGAGAAWATMGGACGAGRGHSMIGGKNAGRPTTKQRRAMTSWPVESSWGWYKNHPGRWTGGICKFTWINRLRGG